MSSEPHDRILLVEGRDDAEVVKQFCNHYGIDNRRLFRIEVKNGIEALLDDLRVRPKAVIHTWLAWQEEPGTALGQAITKRYLDPSRDPAPAFRNWLLELFG